MSLFSNDPNKFKNGTLDTRNYKHPKYCYYIHDQDVVYRVIGYYYILQQYRIRSTKEPNKILMVGAFDIAGIWDRRAIDILKRKYG